MFSTKLLDMEDKAAPPAYLVCGSQRSGSTLLVESLRATGIAGLPEEHFHFLRHSSLAPRPREWFAGVTDERVLALLPPLDPGHPDTRTADEWVEQVRGVGRSANGIWGGKLMWNQVPVVLDRMAEWPERSGDDLRTAIVDLLGTDPIYVHVWREDVVSQAVSMWRAVQTEVWRGPTPPELDDRAQYDARGIAHLARILLDQEAGWQGWFADEGLTPIEIAYQSLVTDPHHEVGRVLAALGLDPELAPDPPLQRQGDDRSKAWIDRYREDAERLDLPR